MSQALRIAHGPFGRVALLDMDASLVRHAHPHCHVLLKAGGADTRFSVRDRLAPLTDGSAVLINAWEPHAYVHDPVRPRSTILALYIEPSWLGAFRRNWTAAGAPGFFETPCGRVSPRIARLAHDLAGVMLADPGAKATQQRLLCDLMVAVIERFADWRRDDGAEPRAGGIDFRIRRAIDMLQREPGQIRHMGRLARACGLSRAHFFRLFEQAVNMTPRMFLNMLRIEAAMAQIMDGETSMTEISDDLGFAVPAHFTRFFRDHAGTAPREFRTIARLSRAGFAPDGI
jgi:AraC-like DNA-binding protein